MVEALMGGEGKDETVKTYFPDAAIEKNEIRVYYDNNWDSCPENEASYLLLTRKEQNDHDLTGSISLFSVTDEENAIYTLPFCYHIALRKGENAS